MSSKTGKTLTLAILKTRRGIALFHILCKKCVTGSLLTSHRCGGAFNGRHPFVCRPLDGPHCAARAFRVPFIERSKAAWKALSECRNDLAHDAILRRRVVLGFLFFLCKGNKRPGTSVTVTRTAVFLSCASDVWLSNRGDGLCSVQIKTSKRGAHPSILRAALLNDSYSGKASEAFVVIERCIQRFYKVAVWCAAELLMAYLWCAEKISESGGR
jgi:hypothetical protein